MEHASSQRILHLHCHSPEDIFFHFQLRPSMERYQQAMVNIITKRAYPQQDQESGSASSEISPMTFTAATATLTCPAGTPQDPSYLTIPFTAPSEEPMTAKEPKRPKEQKASMFIAGSDRQLIIGKSGGDIVG